MSIGYGRSIQEARRFASLLIRILVFLPFLVSCPGSISNREDVKEFIDAGKSMVRIRSAAFYDGSSSLARAPSSKAVTVVLDIINPSALDVTYTVTTSAPDLLSVAPLAHPCPQSCTRVAFTFTADIAAEHRELSFSIGKYAASTNRTFPDETVSITCDSPPEVVESVDVAYNLSNKIFVAFRLPSGTVNGDVSELEFNYARADGSGPAKTVTLDVSAAELTAVASPNILTDTDSRNRYFQPDDVAAGKAYNFWITVIDRAGQRSPTVDTTRLDPDTTRTPIFTTAGGLFALADATKTVTIRGDTPGSTIYWRTAGGAYAAGASNPLDLALSASATIQAYAAKAGLADSAVAESIFELKCLEPDIAVSGSGTTTPTATITGRTAGASLRWRYSYQTDAAATTVAPPDADSMATAAAGTPPEGGSFVAWATKTGWTDSDRSVSDSDTKVATPSFTTPAGTHYCTTSLSVVVSCTTTGSTVLWRRVGEATFTSLGASSGSIVLTEGADLVIMATKPGYVDSDTATATYGLKCYSPTMSPNFSGVCAADTYPVTLSCSTSGVTIHWSHAGGSGTGTSITLDQSRTVTAWASRPGWVDSDGVTRVYSLQCPTPTLTPASYNAVYTGGANFPISISGGPTGSTYAWSHAGGSGAGTSLSIDRSRTVTAVCSRPGWTDSAAASGVYAFTPAAPTSISFTTGNPYSAAWASGPYPIGLAWTTPVFNFGGTLDYQYSFNGGVTWTSLGFVSAAGLSVAGLASGSNFVSLRAYDAAEGRLSTTHSVGFNVDNTPPTVVYVGYAPLGGTNVTLNFETLDSHSGVTTFELTVGGGTYPIATTGGPVSVTITAPGMTFTYAATVYDKAGNITSVTGTISL